MKRLPADVLSAIAVLALGGLMLYWYSSLPDPMPSHWNAAGEVDDYLPKNLNLSILLGIPVFVWILMKIIPLISPKGFRTTEFSEVINVLQVALVLFTCGVGVAVMLEVRGAGIDMAQYVLSGTGLLFVVFGNYMGKVRKNFFIGIRTPWTLASSEVWSKTHRLGGWLFVGAGLVMLVGGLFGLNVNVLVGAVVLAAVVPIVYSFLLYRRIEGFSDEAQDGT